MARTPQFNRQTALHNAMSLFWRQGYHATSMKDIERAIDMRPGSIYAAFGSKEGLFREALATYGEMTKDLFSKTLNQGATELDGLVCLVKSRLGDSCRPKPSKTCMLIKMLLELSHKDQLNNEPVKHYMSELLQMFEDKFRCAIANGELSPEEDPARLARLYQTNILGLSVMAQRDFPEPVLEQLAEDICHHILPEATAVSA